MLIFQYLSNTSPDIRFPLEIISMCTVYWLSGSSAIFRYLSNTSQDIHVPLEIYKYYRIISSEAPGL